MKILFLISFIIHIADSKLIKKLTHIYFITLLLFFKIHFAYGQKNIQYGNLNYMYKDTISLIPLSCKEYLLKKDLPDGKYYIIKSNKDTCVINKLKSNKYSGEQVWFQDYKTNKGKIKTYRYSSQIYDNDILLKESIFHASGYKVSETHYKNSVGYYSDIKSLQSNIGQKINVEFCSCNTIHSKCPFCNCNFLDSIITKLKLSPNSDVDIISHTDTRGSKNKNLELSIGRVHSIENYLIKNGIDSLRIKTFGFGDYLPFVFKNDTIVENVIIKAGTINNNTFIKSLPKNNILIEHFHAINRRTLVRFNFK